MLKPNTDGKINNNRMINVRVIGIRNLTPSPYLITDTSLTRIVCMQFYGVTAATFLTKNKKGK